METATTTMTQEIVSVRLPKQLKDELSESADKQEVTINKLLATMIKSHCDGHLVDISPHGKALLRYWRATDEETSGIFTSLEDRLDNLEEGEQGFLYRAEKFLLVNDFFTDDDKDRLFFPIEEEEEEEEEDEDEEEEMTEEEIREEIENIDHDLERKLTKKERRELIERQNTLLRTLYNL